MAYPFGPPIPFASFIQRLINQHGCSPRGTKPFVGPRGSVTFRYLVRRLPNGETKTAALPDHEPTTEGMPTVIRSICVQLAVDYTAFGVLSDPDDDTDD